MHELVDGGGVDPTVSELESFGMRFAIDDEAAASALWASHERAVGGIYHKLSRARALTLVTPKLTHL